MPDPDASAWQPADPWAGLLDRPRDGTPYGDKGLSIEPVAFPFVANLIATDAGAARLAPIAMEQFGCDLPAPGRIEAGRDVLLVWSGPSQWLALGARTRTVADLSGAFAGAAAIVDQSDSRAFMRIAGRRARDVLARGVAIDLHPRAFAIGATAITKVAHLSVQIWQDDESRYVVAVPRSYVASFWSWLESASLAG